ncbi:MAG: segregation/condensation protein A [Bacillota bacterium]|nr:segregation/condensation protein A [Bacillota bacterium]
MSGVYRVELEVYSGPLDLLLQLVTREEVSIYDIPIARITDQYLTHLRALPELDVETAADFVVLAATLLALKARMLLPAPPPAGGEEPEGGVEEDPRAELVRRLVVYRQYREVAAWLAERLACANATYGPGAPSPLGPRAPAIEPGCLSADLTALALAYQAVLATLAAPPAEHEIPPLPFTVGEKMSAILERLERRGCLPFEELFAPGASRSEVVITFLALLELVRLGRVRARQEQPLGRLELIRNDPGERRAPEGER